MHITIIALGSRGDVLPYATLGKALQAAGHQVRFATFENFSDVIASHGLEFHPIRGDAEAILLGSGQALAESGRSVIRMVVAVMRSFGAMARDYARDLSPLALLDTDLIVSQTPGGLYGYDLAEKQGVPLVAASVIPLVPTAAEPMLAFPTWPSFLPGYNLWTHWMAYQLVWQAFRPTISRWRREALGLEKAPFWGIFRQTQRAIPVLNGFSAHVVTRPPDWGEHVQVTGYWFPEDGTWQPPDGLCRFLESGTQPVFVGFGSMPVRDVERATSMVLEALQRSGQRGILHAGWGGIGRRELPRSVFAIEYAPYGWLFPRLAAVVHHGGSGTTGFALRAGVPSLVVPFLFDQFYWGRRVAELGVGPPPLPYSKLTAGRLARAIDLAVNDRELGRRAQAMGEAIRAEDGLGTAVGILNNLKTNG
jgi:sterol 3beta-glucosyltransferase